MNTPRINELVSRTGASILWTQTLGLLLRATAVIALTIIAAVLIDAGYALPATGLVLLDIALLAVFIYAMSPVIMRCIKGRPDPRATAVYLEQRLNLTDNRLINALDLAQQTAPGTSDALRNEAIARGEAAAIQADCAPVTDRTPIKQTLSPACVAVFGLILAYALLPSMFHAVVPRLFAPNADLPPFTWVKFDVNTEPAPVYHGKPATIHASLSGVNNLDQAQVVFVDDDTRSAPLPMTRLRSSNPDQPTDAPAQFAFRIDRLEGTRNFYIDTPKGRSRLYTLRADTSPLIEHANATYDYPDYTRWLDTAGPLTESGIRALTGTSITLRIESNVPLRSGSLQLTTENNNTPPTDHILTPDSNDPRLATVTFPLTATGQFTLSLVGADDKPGVDTLTLPVTALPDRPPRIDFLTPDQQVVAPEGWIIDTQISAGDDIGLGPVTFHRGLNNQPTNPVPLPTNYTDARRTVSRADHRLDLNALGAKAGDTVRYYAEAQDNHPAAPQHAQTPVHAIHVISMLEYLELARANYRIEDINAEFEAILDRLGELQTQRDTLLEELQTLRDQQTSGEPLSEAQQARLAELEQSLKDYAAAAAELTEELANRAAQGSLYEFEDAYKKMLSELSEQLATQGNQAQALADAMRNLRDAAQPDAQDAAASAFQELADRFALTDEPFTQEVQQQTQTTAQDLEKLRHAEKMMAQGEAIRRIAFKQDELAVRMSSLVNQSTLTDEDRQRARDLAQQQAQLRDELDEARQALREAAESAQEHLPNMSAGALDVADRIDSLAIVPTQSAAEKASIAGNAPIAYQAAREAADKLDSLLSDVTQQPAQASKDLDGCFLLPRQQLQNALNQMASARQIPGMTGRGGSGMGMAGGSARMSLVGPALPGQPGSDSLAKHGRTANNARGGPGQPGSNPENPADDAELIHADPTQHPHNTITQMPGVPTDYIEQAQAYFKRIAEEEGG